MINFFGNLSLFSLVLIPISIIWLIVNLFRKRKKKIPLIVLTAGVLLMVVGIGLSNLPESNTQLSLNSTHIKTDSNGWATLTGTATPGATVEISGESSTFDDYVKANRSGKFEENFTYNGGAKTHTYILSADLKGRATSPNKKVTVTDTTYVLKQREQDKAADKEFSSNTAKKKESKKEFTDSVSALANNTAKRFNISRITIAMKGDDEIVFNSSSDADALSSADKKSLAAYLFNHTDKLASLSDVDTPTTKSIQTSGSNYIARSTITGGVKVYN